MRATTIINDEVIALMTADPGASGNSRVVTSTLLQPWPSQVKQCSWLAQTDSLETQPRANVSPRRRIKQRSLAAKVGHNDGAPAWAVAQAVSFPLAEQVWHRARVEGKIPLLQPGRPMMFTQVSQCSEVAQVSIRSADHSVAQPRTVCPSTICVKHWWPATVQFVGRIASPMRQFESVAEEH